MKTVTTRIPEEQERFLQEIEADEDAARAEVLRRIIDRGMREWREEKALKLLREHKVTLRKAAQIADTTYVEMYELAAEHGITSGYDADELEKDLERR